MLYEATIYGKEVTLSANGPVTWDGEEGLSYKLTIDGEYIDFTYFGQRLEGDYADPLQALMALDNDAEPGKNGHCPEEGYGAALDVQAAVEGDYDDYQEGRD